MKKILPLLLLIILSNLAHAWAVGPLLRLLTSGVAQSFNVGSKFITTQDALESIMERRLGKEYFRYEDGEIYQEEVNADIDISAMNAGNKYRTEAWKNADNARKTNNKNLHHAAIRMYEKALNIDANNWQTWHGYGWSLAALGKYEKASNSFTIAIYLGGDSESWRHLGWNYQRQGYLNEARNFYIKAIQISPNSKAANAALRGVNVALRKESSGGALPVPLNKIFTVQAGAFKAGSNALIAKSKIRSKYKVYIDNSDSDKYLVQIGRFKTLPEARLAIGKLRLENPKMKFFAKMK